MSSLRRGAVDRGHVYVCACVLVWIHNVNPQQVFLNTNHPSCDRCDRCVVSPARLLSTQYKIKNTRDTKQPREAYTLPQTADTGTTYIDIPYRIAAHAPTRHDTRDPRCGAVTRGARTR